MASEKINALLVNRIKFWNGIFGNHGFIYGKDPSYAAKKILPYVKKARRIFELGGAYGRNSVFFVKHGADVICIDASKEAIKLSKHLNKNEKLVMLEGDILHMKYRNEFDLVFSNFVLHLFLEEERGKIFENSYKALKENGYFINTFVSVADESFGNGRELEKNTFEEVAGKPEHFFTKKEIIELYETAGFKVESLEEAAELELIMNGSRETKFWLAVGKKVGK